MVYRHTIDATSYVFEDLRDLLAKATPPRSGDRLAGIAAESAEQMIAARIALSDVPLKQFLHETVIPYEDDEVTRLIVDSHDGRAFAAISSLTVGAFRDWLLSDAATTEVLGELSRGITPEMAAAVSKLMRNQDLILVAKKCRGDHGVPQHHRPARTDERAAAAQSSLRRCQGHHRLDPRRHHAGIRRRLHRHQSGERRSGGDRRTAAAARRDHFDGCGFRPRLASSPM